MRRHAPAALLLALAACEGTIIDIDKDDLVGYEDWKRVDAVGEVPGHGDSYRIIYANETAEDRVSEFDGEWGPGTVIVKEIRERDGDQPGDVRYLGIMRFLDRGDTPDGAELFNLLEDEPYGWLFTYLDQDIDSDEEYRASCWNDCHVAAPYAGAFLNYAE